MAAKEVKCRICEQELPHTPVYFPIANRLSLRTICRKCSAANQKLGREMRKKYIPAPDQKCDICYTTKGSWRHQGSFCRDHDWKTKKFRGFLCDNCNITVGQIEKYIQAGVYENVMIYLQGAK
jgi:hypothetical protein